MSSSFLKQCNCSCDEDSFKSARGSQLHVYATLLAAGVTVCFGAWATLASVPVNWFLSLSLPFPTIRLLTNVVIFAGVGVCMADVFLRVFHALEPERSPSFGFWWLGLHAVIGMELFSLFGIFAFQMERSIPWHSRKHWNSSRLR